MDKRSDDIRQDIESTRASIDEKIDMLESKATEMVDTVKQTATDTIDNVKQTFDVKTQVSERPWVALGLALAAGYVVGNLGNNKDQSDYSSQSYAGASYNYNQQANTGPSTMDTVKAKSRDFLSQFDEEIDLLKVAAMTTLSTFVRDAARQAVPALGPQIDRLLKERGLDGSTTGSDYSSSGFAGSGTGSNYGTGISSSGSYSTGSSGTGSSYSSGTTGAGMGGVGSSYSSGSAGAGLGSAGSSYNTGSSDFSSPSGSDISAGSSSGTSLSSEHGSFSRTEAPNTSMDLDTNSGKVNNDAIPADMNRYGNPPPTPSRDDQDYYTTYQPDDNERTAGGGNKY